VQRIGLFAGPFLGALATHFFGTSGAYGVGLVAVLAATIVLFFVSEPARTGPMETAAPQAQYRRLLAAEWRTFVTVGFGVLLVNVVRASRQVVVPLWGEHIGLDSTTISLVYGASGAIDMLLFYPAGRLMDLRGRAAIAIPSM